ncbi:MAG: lipoate--protein ligase family protein [Gemmatimonadetes bacterium]|nr:lipoate--protein ligase family protein [Gemmatimonadota bacterium]
MAIDQALLDDVDRRGDLAYLRLYRWNPPCLSFGRNEPALSRYDRAEIERLGVDVVRRPTGGRAVWHDDELTYAVAAPVAAFGCLRDSYRVIHERHSPGWIAAGHRPGEPGAPASTQRHLDVRGAGTSCVVRRGGPGHRAHLGRAR